MTADGSSSLLCKAAALLFAGGAHALIFSLARFDAAPPPLVQPAATRVFILPAVVVPPILQEPVAPPPDPEPELEPEPVPEPEPPPILQQEEAPVELPEPPPQEPEPEPTPEPLPPLPEPVPETVSEPEPPATPTPEPTPTLPEPDVAAAPDNSDGVADVPPAPRRPIKPEYPLQARQEQWEGDVTCAVHISPHGRVLEADIVQGSGHEVLDAAALKAVRAARFSPALRRGRPVELRVRLTVSFRLDERR
ncbi:MAG: energy transducer TonB [Kiritimatiellae bacterium]|nr:energy transducer TonB [Kiritimatiellia bacterium]